MASSLAELQRLDMTVGIGYTLATGRLFTDFSEFQSYAQRLLDRPLMTHEFADERVWSELREVFEEFVSEGTIFAGPEEGEG